MKEKAAKELAGGRARAPISSRTKDRDEGSDRILRELMRDSRRSIRQLSQAVGLSGPAVADRVRRLEDVGIIRGYKAVLDHERLGWTVSAFVSVTARQGRCDLVLDALRAHPRVIAAYHIAGATDYLARVAARDLRELNEITESLSAVGTVSSQIVLGTEFERDPS